MSTENTASRPPRPLADLSDEDLASRLRDVERERDEHRVKRPRRPWREDAHAGIDASVEAARGVILATLHDLMGDLSSPAMLPVIPAIADAWVLANDPGVAAAWHQMVDERDDGHFAGGTRAEYRARLDALTAQADALFREQRLRDLDRQREAIDREVAKA